MQWNVRKGLGNPATTTSTQALAIARIVNFNQPDILLFNEVQSLNPATNQAGLIAWVTNNVPYLGAQPGTSFYVAVSPQTDGFNRNCAISRYPILNESVYDDGLRGLHSFQVQLAGTNRLQVFHAHYKCCSATQADCAGRQSNAVFPAEEDQRDAARCICRAEKPDINAFTFNPAFAARPKSSAPWAPINVTRAPARAAATTWFAPLPPAYRVNSPPSNVSPGCGSRSHWMAKLGLRPTSWRRFHQNSAAGF